MKGPANPNIASFHDDVLQNGGYLYTTNARYSSVVANDRITEAILAADVRGKTVLDIGCGDGAFTIDLYDRGQPALIHGLDPAVSAIDCARQRVGGRQITVAVGSAYALPFPDRHFDLAVLRCVLHHMDRPSDALREALRASSRIVVVEPNGYNPVLKVLERVSPYHVAHDEKSYTSWRLDSWVRSHGGAIGRRELIGVVPMFSPTWFARIMKYFEPLLEKIPLVRTLGCAQYVLVASPGNKDRRTEMAA